MNLTEKKIILGNGYLKYIGHMGSDETFVEAARMSTGKGFYSWYWEEDTYADCVCIKCNTQHLMSTLPYEDVCDAVEEPVCTNCWAIEIQPIGDLAIKMGKPDFVLPKLLGKKGAKRDLNLLETLYSSKHSSPFEMGELAIEIKVPILVVREWVRHRTQSFSEFSARYSQMPNEHYVPERDRIQKQSKTNKQGSSGQFDSVKSELYIGAIISEQQMIYNNYNHMVEDGMAKEIARINTPVSRMSKMRAKTDIRNWLGFLSLRMENSAQFEIREYANAVASLIKQLFPKTFELFLEYDFLGTRFSRTEMREIREIFRTLEKTGCPINESPHLSKKQLEALHKKLSTNREDEYKEVLEKL